MLRCLACHGLLVKLGRLANRQWFRCRHCGLDQSTLIQHTEVDDYDA